MFICIFNKIIKFFSKISFLFNYLFINLVIFYTKIIVLRNKQREAKQKKKFHSISMVFNGSIWLLIRWRNCSVHRRLEINFGIDNNHGECKSLIYSSNNISSSFNSFSIIFKRVFLYWSITYFSRFRCKIGPKIRNN